MLLEKCISKKYIFNLKIIIIAATCLNFVEYYKLCIYRLFMKPIEINYPKLSENIILNVEFVQNGRHGRQNLN